MGSPYVHAELSAKRFGGEPEDYMEIHELLDSSKNAFPDLRHRALTHNSWFTTVILEKIFGPTITNSVGKKISVREIAQWHIMEDYGGSFPSVQDFLSNIQYQKWMNNGEDGTVPPSNEGLPPFDKKLLEPTSKTEGREFHMTPEELDEIPHRMPNAIQRGCGGGGRMD